MDSIPEEESFDKWENTGQTIDDQSVISFTPNRRPPMAVLVAFDDGCTSGECIRLRKDRFTIGRSEADFVVPHDPQIDPLHVAIIREQSGGRYRWTMECGFALSESK